MLLATREEKPLNRTIDTLGAAAADPGPVINAGFQTSSVRNASFLTRGRPSGQPEERSRSRRTFFWILPVEVFGSSPNTTRFGAL